MKPSDLYREVAEQEARRLHDGDLTPERRRYEEAEQQLRERAAGILDEFENRALVEQEVYFKDNDRTRVVYRKVVFTLPAPEEIEKLINDPDSDYREVVLRLTLGTNDVSHRDHGDQPWSNLTRCASMDALTTIEGIEYEYESDEVSTVDELFTRLERLNYMHPVLDSYYGDPSDQITADDHFIPTDRMHAIQGFNA